MDSAGQVVPGKSQLCMIPKSGNRFSEKIMHQGKI
jgi:hypothetical protein